MKKNQLVRRHLFIAALGFAVTLALIPQGGWAQFTTPVNVSTTVPSSLTEPPSLFPRPGISGSNVFVAWQEDVGNAAETFFARSTDGGATFSTPVNLSNTPDPSQTPQLAASGSIVCVAWAEFVGFSSGVNPNKEIFARCSADGGGTFGSTVNVSDTPMVGPASAGASRDPSIAISGTNVFVAWLEDTVTGGFVNPDIFFRRLTVGAGGVVTLGSTVNLSGTSDLSSAFPFEHPASIAASGSIVCVAWDEVVPNSTPNLEIFATCSADGGGTFGSTVNVSNTPPDVFGHGTSVFPFIAISGTDVFVAWQETLVTIVPAEPVPTVNVNLEVFFARSTDGGGTFGTAVNLSNTAGASEIPQLTTRDSNVYVAWQEDVAGSPEVFFRRSADGGGTFEPTVNLSNTAEASRFPQLAASNSNVYVAWTEAVSPAGVDEIFFRRSADGGATFEPTVNVSTSPLAPPSRFSELSGLPFFRQLVASNALVCAAWEESVDVFVSCTSFAPPPTNECPLTQGFWKNHPEAWPVTSLTLGAQSYTQAELLALLQTPVGAGKTADASLILAHQLIAAKLSIANGSDPAPVAGTLSDADSLLGGFSGKLPYKVKPSSATGQSMVNDANVLDSYNNGALTPTCTP